MTSYFIFEEKDGEHSALVIEEREGEPLVIRFADPELVKALEAKEEEGRKYGTTVYASPRSRRSLADLGK